MAPAPLFSFDDLDSYDGDVETCSSYTGTDALATPLFVPTSPSTSPVRSRALAAPHHMQLQHRLSAVQKYHELNLPQASHRSNSTLTFSPGAHRRSHASVQHLSLAPLTPKYPITPSDYDAYVDPDTSQLHTSSSLSHIASMPSPGGILSQSGSRSSSKTRHRKSKSTVSIQVVTGTPRGALTSAGFGGRMIDPADAQNREYSDGMHTGPKKNDSSWLLQTGMALTEGSRESKGQSWIAKRASSTSLLLPSGDDYTTVEYTQSRSGRDTPTRSRRSSRDRRKSRRELAMTPADLRASFISETAGVYSRSELHPTPASTYALAAIEPDWADSQTQAEIAADLEMDLAEELEDGELYSDDDDGFDGLDSGEQGIADDEREIEQAVRARGFRIGKWVDGVIDVFLKMDEADEDELEAKPESAGHEATALAKEESKTTDHAEQSSRQAMDDMGSDDDMEPAPQNPKSVWEDLAWFGRLILRTARS
jgi:Protein of unknown function (DUF3984)